MKLEAKQVIRSVLLLFPLIVGNGCATSALWKNDNLETWNEPANKANLHLFEAKPRSDFLVVYDEYSERKDTTQTRAYWLKENQPRVSQRNAPLFINTNSVMNLPGVPVFNSAPSETNFPPKLYAVIETNQQSFTLFFNGAKIETYDLPVYNDRTGKLKKIFFTPPAVTADITIIGGVIGYFYITGLASGYNSSY